MSVKYDPYTHTVRDVMRTPAVYELSIIYEYLRGGRRGGKKKNKNIP